MFSRLCRLGNSRKKILFLLREGSGRKINTFFGETLKKLAILESPAKLSFYTAGSNCLATRSSEAVKNVF